MNYSDRHRKFPGKIIISYQHRWGGQRADCWLWLGELNGEVWDYDSKKNFIAKAIAENFDYVVLRVHRDGSATVVPNYPV